MSQNRPNKNPNPVKKIDIENPVNKDQNKKVPGKK